MDDTDNTGAWAKHITPAPTWVAPAPDWLSADRQPRRRGVHTGPYPAGQHYPPLPWALTATWWPGSDEPLLIAQLATTRTEGRRTHSSLATDTRAQLRELAASWTMAGWADDHLVIPTITAVRAHIGGQAITVQSGRWRWAHCARPDPDLWQPLGRCLFGVTTSHEEPSTSLDYARAFLDALDDGHATIGELNVVHPP